MDSDERSQVRLILESLGEETRATSAEQQRAMHADHASRGVLKSGATVKAAARICEAVALDYVKQSVDRVSVVAQDTDAFAMIATDLTILLRELKAPIDQAIEFTTGTGPEKTLQYASIYAEGNRLFRELETRASRLLEIQRFNFVKLGKSRTATPFPVPTASPPAARSNPGGKPLGKHWDALWAEIAVQLWSGELDPKRQADITKAMSDWLASQNIDASETAIVQRARSLWQRIEARRLG